jgi:hypothetical protein
VSVQQIRAAQILSGTLTTTQLAAAAGITDGQLAASYLYANGSRALTGILNGGGFEAQNFANPTASQSLATKSYVDSVAQGLSPKPSARAATVGTETFTIVSGSVTVINGTTLDGVSPAVNDYVLIKDSPAASGPGSAMSTQPGNGLYQVTSTTTNLSVSRAASMSGANGPAGAYVFVEGGTANAAAGFTVSTPSTNSGFTYGTNNIAWTQFSGAGEITVDSTLVKTGNQLARAAITGNVTIPANSNTATIANAAVTLAMLANLAANSVIANTTGSAATPAAVALTAAPTASTVGYRDANANLAVNSLIEGAQSVAAAGATTTLTVASPELTQISGTTSNQTVVLPNATTLVVGQQYTITNRTTSGTVTVNANGGGLLQTMANSSQCTFTLLSAGTAAGTWDSAYAITNAGAGGGSVTSVSVVSANGFAGSVATATTTPAITMQTSINAMLKGNGTALVAATAGTDYMAPADFVTRETPTGTLNGSNTTFTLANTPISGTEMVFLNGLLQNPGAGNDYTVSGATITYLTAPVSTDVLRVSYQK